MSTSKSITQPAGAHWKNQLVSYLAIAGVIFVGGLLYWRVGNAVLKDQASQHNQPNAPVWQERADIVDRNGITLASTEERFLVWLDLTQFVPTHGDEVVALAQASGIGADQLMKQVSYTSSSPHPNCHLNIAYNVMPAQASLLRARARAGVYLEPMQTRLYPQGALTAHVVGLVSADSQADALMGAELQHHETIRARELAAGAVVKPPAPVRLSIDIGVQSLAREALQQAMRDSGASHAAVVVADVSGQIRAAVSLPEFDPAPHQRATLQLDKLNHLALTDSFMPPASLWQPLHQALKLSQGGLGHEAAQRLNRLQLQRLGFGQPRDAAGLGQSLAATERLLPHGSPKFSMNPVERSSPMQLLAAYLALTDQGRRVALSMNDALGSDHGSTDPASKVFDPSVVAQVRAEMAAPNGPCQAPQAPGQLLGSTAAWVSREAGKTVTRDLFIGMAPLKAPQFVVMLLLANSRQPITGHPAKRAAAKIAAQILQKQ